MRRFSLTMIALLAGVWMSGCNKGTDPAVATNSDGVPGVMIPAKPKLVIAANAGPDVVVSTFLDATRAGNDVAATELLTTKAREETAKEGLTLDLPVSPSMKYKIAKVDFLEGNKEAAYVNSIWTESYATGPDSSFEVVWVLRKQNDGWRIAGMAAQNVPEEPPIFLNFEDPEDVQRIKEKVTTGEPAPATGPAVGQPPANGFAQPPANGVVPPPANGQVQPPTNGFAPPPANGFSQQQPVNGFGQQPPSGNGFGQQPPPNGFAQPPANGPGQPPSNFGGQFPTNSAQNPSPSPFRK